MLGNSSMLLSKPPRHSRLRSLVAREFTARRVEGMRGRIQEITDELLDRMTADGGRRADLIDAFAPPLPMTASANCSASPAWTALVHMVEEGGDRLTEDELLSMALLLLVAGHETMVDTISNAVRALLANPEPRRPHGASCQAPRRAGSPAGCFGEHLALTTMTVALASPAMAHDRRFG